MRQQGSVDLPGDIFLSAKSAAHQLPDHVHAFFCQPRARATWLRSE